MTPKQTRHITFAAFLGLPLAVLSLRAQTAPARPVGSETVELSPFQVSAESVTGYAASETMSGSRVKTPILDLPYTVNVMTNEFLADFGIFELSDNVSHIGGFTGLDVGGNFVLRGFTSNNQLRDGFFRLGRYGSSNIDRIEIIKGSNAAIYGRSSPGGMMNMISKAPKSTANQKLSLNYGDYGTQRVTFEGTGPLLTSRLGQTNYLLTASYYQRDFEADWTLARNQEYFLALDHIFRNGAKFTLMAEYFKQQRHSPLSGAPVIIDKKGTGTSATIDVDDVAIGYAENLAKNSTYGPNSRLNRDNTSVTGTLEKKLGEILSLRASGNLYSAGRDDYNQNTNWGTILINKANTVPPFSQRGATPNWGRIFEDGGSFQGDLLARYWTNDRKLEHRTLLTVDFNDYYRWDPTISYAGATHPDIVAWNLARSVTVDANYNPVGPIGYFTKSPDPVNGFVSTRKMKRRISVLGGLLRHQSSLLGGRLLGFTGARFDSIRYRHRDFLTAASSFTPFIPGYRVGDQIRKTITSFNPNLGANFKLKENLRVYASYSRSFFQSQGDNPIEIANPTYKPETADGWDYGFKGSGFGDRLTYTISGFYISRQNVSVDDIDPVTGVTVSRRDGDQLVRGYEADVSWSLTNEWFLLGSYGNVHSIYTDFGDANPQAIGRKVQYVAPYNGSFTVKFSPSRGLMKNFSTNLGVTFMGATPTETPIAGDTVTGPVGRRVVTFSSRQWALTVPAYQVWSVGARYTLQSGRGMNHTFAVNVNNALNKQFLRAGTSGATRILQGDDRAIFITYTINHKGAKF
jgi:iron complex outermembrane receptor protein